MPHCELLAGLDVPDENILPSWNIGESAVVCGVGGGGADYTKCLLLALLLIVFLTCVGPCLIYDLTILLNVCSRVVSTELPAIELNFLILRNDRLTAYDRVLKQTHNPCLQSSEVH